MHTHDEVHDELISELAVVVREVTVVDFARALAHLDGAGMAFAKGEALVKAGLLTTSTVDEQPWGPWGPTGPDPSSPEGLVQTYYEIVEAAETLLCKVVREVARRRAEAAAAQH